MTSSHDGRDKDAGVTLGWNRSGSVIRERGQRFATSATGPLVVCWSNPAPHRAICLRGRSGYNTTPRCSRDIMSVSSANLVTAHRNHRRHRDGSRLLPAATRRREDCRGTYPARLLEDYAPQVDQALRYERHSRRDLQYAFSSLEVPLPESSPRHCLRTVLLRLPDTAAPKWLQSTQEASFLLPPGRLGTQAPLSLVLVVDHPLAHHRSSDGNTLFRSQTQEKGNGYAGRV